MKTNHTFLFCFKDALSFSIILENFEKKTFVDIVSVKIVNDIKMSTNCCHMYIDHIGVNVKI